MNEQKAATAQALMRSRYTAFVLCDADYLLATWHTDTRPKSIEFHPRQRWLGLRVRHTESGMENDPDGTVEFVARFKIDGRGHRLHERSRFVKEQNRWFYLDGAIL
jgi:SEC-C motif-containing protein